MASTVIDRKAGDVISADELPGDLLSFAVESNAMAPALLGWHTVEMCPTCGKTSLFVNHQRSPHTRTGRSGPEVSDDPHRGRGRRADGAD